MRPVVAVCMLVCLFVVCAGPASAHGNHLSVDDQYSEDGTVVVETVFSSSEGFLVLHADDGGEPGEPIGHAPTDFGFTTGMEVNVSEEVWRNQENAMTVWAVLHLDDGDGEFEPGRDEPVPAFGGEAEKQFVVGKRGAGPASVVASDFDSQETSGTVTVDRVALGRDGALVVRADRNGTPGRAVGRTSLSAGVHENVTVSLDRSFYREQASRFTLWATLAEGGSPVVINESPIASEFGVRKGERSSTSTTGGPDSTTRAGAQAGGAKGTSGAFGPGFGVGVAFAVVVVVAMLVRSRCG